MRAPKCTVIDFETQGIEGRPNYPPVPVGVAVKEWGKKGRYFAFGHPTGNNCSRADAVRVVEAAMRGPILYYNSKFDEDVAETHFKIKRPPSLNIHDAMFLMFLRDPHSRELGLKPLAERFLGEPPDEQDAVKAWVMAHKKELEAGHGKFTPSQWGKHIAQAPGYLVGKYAVGDVNRTEALFKYAWDWVINEHGMLEPYEREQKVMPLFLDNERVGIRCDVKNLRADVAAYGGMLEGADTWLRKRLKSPSLELDNDNQVLEALLRNKIVREDQLALTPTGKFSISKKTLTPDLYADARVASAFGYRNRLQTCLKMFMQPWLTQVTARGDGYISTNWNQVRGTDGGTRTGRPSTRDPNFLNVSQTWDNNDDGYKHPEHLGAEALPLVRKYLLPDKGEQWLHRDFNGQELRLLAHFEDGPLMEAYKKNPWLDVHQYVSDLIEDKTGKRFARKQVKITNFRIIYGGGATSTAAGIGCSIEEAKELLRAHGAALPSVNGRGGIVERCKAIGKSGGCLYTWGGRAYYVEPPSFNKKYNRSMTYEFKMLNMACQGSAADVTKQSMINYSEHPKRRGRFMVQVYDELNASSGPAPKEEMAVLREAMESVSNQMDVPMLSEGKSGATWGNLKEFKEGPSAYV